MSRTVLPLEDTRASSINELKDLVPQTDHVVTLEGGSSPADGASNIFWWDPSGDPQDADGVTLIESNIESNGLWRRIVTPAPETTDDLPEGSSKLYFDEERVDDRIDSLIVPGVHLSQTYNDSTDSLIFDVDDDLSSYSNDVGFITDLSGFDTDDLGEGSANRYYTESRFDSSFSGKSTDDLSEGSGNLYFTDTRVRNALSAGGDLNYDPNTGEFSISTSSLTSTDELSEGSNNLYHTTERVRNALSAGGDLSYDSSTGEFSVSTSGLGSTDDLPEGSTNFYYTSDRVKNEFEATGDLTYVKNPVSGYDLSNASYTGTSFDISSEEGIASGVTFGDGGSKMFVVGIDNQNVFEYSLGTAFDISTASYTGTSLDVGGDDGGPRGIAFSGDGTKMFMAGASDNNVYEYELPTAFDLSTASYSGTSFDIGSEEGDVRALTFNGDGTKMFITGSSSATSSSADVHEYNLSGGYDISTASYSGNVFDVSSEESTPLAIAFNGSGTKMFVAGNDNKTVHEYALSAGFDISTATYSGTSFDVSSEESGYPTAVTFSADGTKMFIIGTSSDSVHEYDTAATGGKAQFGIDVSEVPDLLGSSTTDDLSEGSGNLYFTEQRAKDAAETGPSDFATGENIQYKDYSGQIKFVGEYDLSGQSDWQDAEALAFNNDGTKVFFTGDNSSTSDCIVVEYDLGTAYDIQTLGYTGNTFPNTFGNLTGIDFNADGTKMFVSDGSSEQIIEYTLGSGFDLSSTVSQNNTYDTSSEGGSNPDGLELNKDGTKLFTIDDGDIYEYSLGTAYDLSTISFTTSFGLDDFENRALSFNGDGSVMYTTLGIGDTVLKYELSTPFDVSTASYTGTEFSNIQSGNGRGMVVIGSKLFGVDNERIGQYNIDPSPEFSLVNISGVGDSTTDDLSEGSNNLYFTEERVDDRVDSLIVPGLHLSSTYNDSSDSLVLDADDNLSSYSNDAGFITDLNTFTTDDLSEGSNNLYYTSDRVKNEFEAGGDITYIKNPSAGFDLSSATYSNTSFDIESETTFPQGLVFNSDGTKMFVPESDSNNVYEYSLTTGFDVTTASLSSSFDISSEDTAPQGVAFNTDGTKMLVVGTNNADVYEYNLSAGFDVTTASYSGTAFDVNPESVDPKEIEFNSGGTKMFLVAGNEQKVFEYGLGTGFDMSTASYSGTAFDISSQEIDPTGITFAESGTKMFITGTSSDSVHEYELTTGFDLSTASYTGTSFDVSSEASNAVEAAFNGDGTKMFVLGGLSENIYEYNTSAGTTNPRFTIDVSEIDDLLSSSTTDDLVEGSTNFYFTDERAQDAAAGALVGGDNIQVSYDDGTNEISVDFAGISVDEDGTNVLSGANSVNFGKALAATDDGSGAATVDLDAGFSSATFSGDGTKTQFQIPHGLSSQPSSWIVQSATGDGSDISHVTADGTSLTVNYGSAPPSGTDNVELNWIAIQ